MLESTETFLISIDDQVCAAFVQLIEVHPSVLQVCASYSSSFQYLKLIERMLFVGTWEYCILSWLLPFIHSTTLHFIFVFTCLNKLKARKLENYYAFHFGSSKI